MRIRDVLAWLAMALFLACGAYGCSLGWGTDRDSLRVIASAQSILAGTYLRSRSFGFPLHEAACAVLFRLGGLPACNAGSLVVTACGIVLAARLVPPARAWLAIASFSLCPLLLANASSAIDFGWDFTAGMALCLAARRLLRGAGSAAAYGLAGWLLLLLRPDNVLFLAAVTLALVWGAPAIRGRVLAAAALAGIGAACLYLGLNGVGMLTTAVTSTRPWPSRLLRAAVFVSAALGPGGACACAALVRAPSGDPAAPEAVFLRRAAWLGWALYLPRFAALPDQMEYLILPVCLSMVAFLAWVPGRFAVWACVAFCVPSLVTVSVFRRDAASGALSVRLAPQWGAVAQDWAARRFAMRMEGPAAVAAVSARTGLAGLRYDVFMPGYISAASDLVIGRAHLYRVLPMGGGVGALATVPRGLYRAIWACDAALGPGIGWRGWEAPVAERGEPGACRPAQ
jgi:hypothetical protein